MDVKQVTRIFKIKVNGQFIELEDPNEALPASDVKELYSNQYPELLNAQIKSNGIQNDKLEFEFVTVAGTKG